MRRPLLLFACVLACVQSPTVPAGLLCDTQEPRCPTGFICDMFLGTCEKAQSQPPQTTPGMVAVAAGSFTMGCNPGDPDCRAEAQPRHTVDLDAFEIDRTEVSQATYKQCVDDAASPNRCTAPNLSGCGGGTWDPVGTPNRAVVCVTWQQAKTFCTWAGKRLPTEAEWEKAARGTDARSYPWGADPPDCSRANYSDCSVGVDAVDNRPAGASPYQAINMAGNVFEWVADYFSPSAYTSCLSGCRNPQGPASGPDHVIRGGNAFYTPDWLRTWARGPWPSSGSALGFRCAK